MAQVKPTNKKKMSKPALAATIVSIVILLGLVVSLLAGSGLFIRIQNGASSENFDINASMMSYYTNSYYQNWYQQNYYYILLGYLKFDPQASLKEQYTDTNKTQTWYDYFVEGAKTTATTYLKYCEAAKADKDVNFEEMKAEAEQYAKDSIKSIKESAKKNNLDTKTYIRQYFGEYVNQNDLKKALILEHIAADYYEVIHDRIFDGITEEREDKYFGDNLANFISAEYLTFTLSSTVTAEKVDEKEFDGGKNSQEYKDAVAAAEAKAKAQNELNKINDKEFLDKLATAKTADEFKTMLLEYKFSDVFDSTYETAVKNFATPDKPSADDLKAYKDELTAMMQKFIDAVLNEKEDIEKDTDNAEPADETTETKWEKAKKTFTKTLVTNLKAVITSATKTSSYTLESDLGKFLFAGVKAQYNLEYKEGEEKGENASLNETHFEDKTFTADADKNIGKYSMSIYFVTETAHRDEAHLRNVGHILFKVDTTTATDPAVSYKTKAEAKEAAEKLYEEIKKQLVDGKITKEKFEEFGKNTHDGEVFYDDVNKGDMVEPFEEWLFDEARVEGEIGLVETTYGWHIMYFGGESDEIAWRFAAHEGSTNEDLETWYEELPYEVDINNSIFDKIFG